MHETDAYRDEQGNIRQRADDGIIVVAEVADRECVEARIVQLLQSDRDDMRAAELCDRYSAALALIDLEAANGDQK
ncbi:hypothetical protein [Nocardia flavorosea]|uniref:Uncharacterized protein n=1 Tax=Nocardia flavorosea TaxID=53429 RepID=A0A846YTU5_9NOCA|nr:hypothetical protein [Nocardia flavorosea]NKY60399.1 hypothetical protein [Nocardia flavorosea]